MVRCLHSLKVKFTGSANMVWDRWGQKDDSRVSGCLTEAIEKKLSFIGMGGL